MSEYPKRLTARTPTPQSSSAFPHELVGRKPELPGHGIDGLADAFAFLDEKRCDEFAG